MKTSIVIITYNNIEYTKQCIESIRNHTEKESYEIIVVDNNSIDGTIDWLKSNNDINCIFNKENKGFPAACNQGIKFCSNNDILLLNNDVIVTPNWLFNLNKCLYSSLDIGAVGAITNNSSYYQFIPVSYKSKEEMIDFAKKNNISDPSKWEERLKLIGFCMLIKREVIDKIGLLDEEFYPGNYEDDDYCLRIRQKGYRLLLCRDSYVHHFGSASFIKDTNKFNNILQKNLLKFESKWKASWYDLFDVRLDITQFIDKKGIDSFSFLHIGSKGGGTLLYIKNKYKNSKLYGIEENKTLLINLDHFSYVKSPSDGEWNNNKEKFDFIFIEESDIVNILSNLNLIKDSYKKNSVLILSIPKACSAIEDNIKEGLEELFENFYLDKLEKDNKIDFLIHLNPCNNKIKIINIDEKSSLVKEENNKVIDINKIDFICCVRDKNKFNLTLDSIKQLNIPPQFKASIITLENKESYTSSYNAAMQKSNAKYKVYLHDDITILNKNFIYDILNIFNSSSNIGLIGVVGAKSMPHNGIWWESDRIYGKIYDSHTGFMQLLEFNTIHNEYEKVEVIDGLIMITQYDLPWREDLFNGWHFYDISQSFKFRKNGYEVVVPRQNLAWCKHDCGIFKEHEQFEYYRKTFVNEYLNITQEINNEAYILSLFSETEDGHLAKDIVMIPITMYKYFGYKSKVAYYINNNYENLNTQVKGLNIDFIEKITGNPEIDIYAYLVENSKNISMLLLYELEPSIFKWIDIYKTMNPKGQCYLILNKKIYSKDQKIVLNLNSEEKELLGKFKVLLVEFEGIYKDYNSKIDTYNSMESYWINVCNDIIKLSKEIVEDI